MPKFTCFLVIDLKGKNMGVKRRNFTRQTDVALISTILIRLGSDLTRSTTMHTQKFHILLPNFPKCTLLSAFFSLLLTKKFPVLVNSNKKPFPFNSEHNWGHPQSSEWNRKEESPLQSHNGKIVLGFSCHMKKCICNRK